MKETKLTISNKTVKVNLPDVSGANLKSIMMDSSGNLGVGFGSGTDSTPFNGERPIVAPIPGLQGTVLHGTTKGEVLTNFLKVLFPAQGPTASLSANLPQREHGADSDVVLTWSAAKGDVDIASVNVNTVNITPLTLSGTQNTSTIQDTDKTFSMSVLDINGLSASASASVQYFHNRYWFQSTSNLLASSDAQLSSTLQALGSKEFATSRQQSRSFTLGGEYIYFAYPASFGTASFVVGGLPNTAYQLKTFQYTNANGYVEPYNLYRSGNAGTGSINVVLN